MLPSRRSGVVLSALAATVALLASVLLVTPSASAAPTGRARGAIYGASGTPTMTLQWFTADWHYLGKRTIHDGIYSLTLAPGSYRLQLVDRRPAYNLKKYAPTDVFVTVRAGATTTKNVRMQRGAAVYGVARAGGKVAAGAKVVAANTYRQSFAVKADSRGRFAIGGLPRSRYSVFAYDRHKTYVGKSTWLGTLKPGKAKKVNPNLKVRGGRLLVDLYAGSDELRSRVTVTVVSKATGQWWSATSSGGSVSFSGLYPGGYTITVPGAGVWFGRTGTVSGATVRPGRVAFGSFRLIERGGWVTGQAVDGGAATYPIANAQVQLYNAAGVKVAETTSSASGTFMLAGALATQSGMTVVVNPGPGGGGWTKGERWCHFAPTTVHGVHVTKGQPTPVGTVLVARTSADCSS